MIFENKKKSAETAERLDSLEALLLETTTELASVRRTLVAVRAAMNHIPGAQSNVELATALQRIDA